MDNKQIIRDLCNDEVIKEFGGLTKETKEKIINRLQTAIAPQIRAKKQYSLDGLENYLKKEIDRAENAVNEMLEAIYSIPNTYIGVALNRYAWNLARKNVLQEELDKLQSTQKPQQENKPVEEESKPVEEGANVPTLWKSKKYFMEMLTEAVAMGLLEHDGKGGYVWQMSNSLYGVFVYRISKEFGIMSVCKKRDKTSTQSTQRIQWTKFGKFIHAANAEDKAMMATAMTVVAEHRDKTKWACDDFSIIVGNEYINKLIADIKILKQRS